MNRQSQSIEAFDLDRWSWQSEVLTSIHSSSKFIVLKARQLGVSWLACAYATWLMHERPGSAVLLLSHGQREAADLLWRVQFVHDNLPSWYDTAGTTKRAETMFELDNGSRALAMPSTQDAGRGFQSTLVILDEHARHPYADENWLSIEPSISMGGKLVVVSTASGTGNLYHRLWQGAPGNGFESMFLPWSRHPDRDEAWLGDRREGYDDPALFAQEYPTDPTEAFVVSGRPRWDTGRLQRALAVCVDPVVKGRLAHASDGSVVVEAIKDAESPMSVWSKPEKRHRYVVGVDVAHGIPGGAFSAAQVLDATTREQVAVWHARCEPDILAEELLKIAKYYNGAMLAIEVNDAGISVIDSIKPRYNNLFPRESYDQRRGGRDRFGWHTNTRTKSLLEDAIGEVVRDPGAGKINDAGTVREMMTYQVGDNGRAEPAPGCYSDKLIALGIALVTTGHGRGYRLPEDKPQPELYTLPWFKDEARRQHTDDREGRIKRTL